MGWVRVWMAAVVGLGVIAGACASFGGDGGGSVANSDSGAEDVATASSSGASSSGASSSSASSSSSGGLDAGPSIPCIPCNGGLFCDPFERPEPLTADWSYFGMAAGPNFGVSEATGSNCGRVLRSYVGAPSMAGFSTRMLRRTLNAAFHFVTTDFDLSYDSNLAGYTGGSYAALVVLGGPGDITPDSPFTAIIADADGLAMARQSRATDSTKATFSLTPNVFSHLRWRVDATNGEADLFVNGILVKHMDPSATQVSVQTQLQFHIGVAGTKGAQPMDARFDNVTLTAEP